MARREGSWAAEPGGGETRLEVSRNVLLLGVVSLLTDVSSEISVTFLPFFLANVLGVKTAAIGLIEGVAESTASLTRLGSGWLSDRWRVWCGREWARGRAGGRVRRLCWGARWPERRRWCW